MVLDSVSITREGGTELVMQSNNNPQMLHLESPWQPFPKSKPADNQVSFKQYVCDKCVFVYVSGVCSCQETDGARQSLISAD